MAMLLMMVLIITYLHIFLTDTNRDESGSLFTHVRTFAKDPPSSEAEPQEETANGIEDQGVIIEVDPVAKASKDDAEEEETVGEDEDTKREPTQDEKNGWLSHRSISLVITDRGQCRAIGRRPRWRVVALSLLCGDWFGD